jgi:transposase-like protein
MSVNDRNKVTLSSKKYKAVTLLVSGKSQRDTAKELGINEKTLYRWLEETDFYLALREKQERVIREAERLLGSAISTAVKKLVSIIEDPETSPSVQVSSCRILLDSALKYRQNLEIEDRISRLESLLQE